MSLIQDTYNKVMSQYDACNDYDSWSSFLEKMAGSIDVRGLFTLGLTKDEAKPRLQAVFCVILGIYKALLDIEFNGKLKSFKRSLPDRKEQIDADYHRILEKAREAFENHVTLHNIKWM